MRLHLSWRIKYNKKESNLAEFEAYLQNPKVKKNCLGRFCQTGPLVLLCSSTARRNWPRPVYTPSLLISFPCISYKIIYIPLYISLAELDTHTRLLFWSIVGVRISYPGRERYASINIVAFTLTISVYINEQKHQAICIPKHKNSTC
jgi:hypothetical protein